MGGSAQNPAGAVQEAKSAGAGNSVLGLDKTRRTFTRRERLQLFLITCFGQLAVQLIGRSLRWNVFGRENYDKARRLGYNLIVTFWHCQIFPAVWFWRGHRMMVMVSENFDGEYTSRVIHRYGYSTARGSSSRRASRVLVEMIRALRQGGEAAITPDGPRGPRFVAKPGVVQLAKHSAAAILCFHITPGKSWVLRKSWDQTEIPKPFSRAAIFIAPPIFVPPGADDGEQARKLQEVQAALDGLVRQGEAWRVNSNYPEHSK